MYAVDLPHSHPLLYVGGCKVLVKVDNKLGKLFDMDDILRMIRVSVDYLSATSNLQGERERERERKQTRQIIELKLE